MTRKVKVKSYKRFRNNNWEHVRKHEREIEDVELSKQLLKDIREGKAVKLETESDIVFNIPENKKLLFGFGDYFGMGMTEEEIAKYEELHDLEEKAQKTGLTKEEYERFKELVEWEITATKMKMDDWEIPYEYKSRGYVMEVPESIEGPHDFPHLWKNLSTEERMSLVSHLFGETDQDLLRNIAELDDEDFTWQLKHDMEIDIKSDDFGSDVNKWLKKKHAREIRLDKKLTEGEHALESTKMIDRELMRNLAIDWESGKPNDAKYILSLVYDIPYADIDKHSAEIDQSMRIWYSGDREVARKNLEKTMTKIQE